MMRAIKLRDWYIFRGSIVGIFPDGQERITSLVISMDENIVTTRTGSRYDLTFITEKETDQLLRIIRFNNSKLPKDKRNDNS